jgi:hypothetical protein
VLRRSSGECIHLWYQLFLSWSNGRLTLIGWYIVPKIIPLSHSSSLYMFPCPDHSTLSGICQFRFFRSLIFILKRLFVTSYSQDSEFIFSLHK